MGLAPHTQNVLWCEIGSCTLRASTTDGSRGAVAFDCEPIGGHQKIFKMSTTGWTVHFRQPPFNGRGYIGAHLRNIILVLVYNQLISSTNAIGLRNVNLKELLF